jgi:Lrp/AsnC family leucine-responsive transcriptional regulator
VETTSISLDAMDRRLMRALQEDGRLPIVALAERVGLSATPCQRRVRRLEEAGVIRGYAARLDPARVGLPLQAFVQVALQSHAEEVVERFHAALAQRPEVIAAYMESFGDFATRALLRLPGVKETRSSFVLATLKPPGVVPV